MKIKMVMLAVMLSILLIVPATSYKADMVDNSHIKWKSNEIETAIITDGNTLYVGGSGPNNYTKIQDAINDSNDGDTIFVYDDSSPYYENVVINKSVKLVGEYRENTVIMANGKDAVNITANKVSVSGFMITSRASTRPFAGVKICKAGNATISNCDICSFGIAVYMNISYGNKIERCNMRESGTGIETDSSNKNVFVDCNIYNNSDGIWLCSSHENIISKCNIYDNDVGIDIMGVKNVLSSCNITNNKIGIYISGFSNKITRCNICENSVWGIMLLVGSANKVINNNFCGNKINAFFTNAAFNVWLRNYWKGWIFPFPKPIFGFLVWSFREAAIPWLNFDWMPRMMPYRGGR